MKPNPLYLLFLLVMISMLPLLAQPEAYLMIKNETIDGGEFTFDIYVSTPAGSAPAYLLLGNSDFVMRFDPGVFNNPSVDKIGGMCTFVPDDTSGNNILFTQDNYDSQTMVELEQGKIIINVQGPAPTQQTILTRVAKIDSDTTMHRLGQFRLNGLTDDQADPSLRWKTAGTGLNTKVFTVENTDPFLSIPAVITTNRPECPQLLILGYPINNNQTYHAQSILEISSLVDGGAQISLHAGDQVLLQPGFSVAQGSTLTIQMDGCP